MLPGRDDEQESEREQVEPEQLVRTLDEDPDSTEYGDEQEDVTDVVVKQEAVDDLQR